MLDSISAAQNNVRQNGETYAIVVAAKGRYTYATGMFFLFMVFGYGLFLVLRWELTDPSYESTLLTYAFLSVPFLLFGYLAVTALKSILFLNEVLLLPEKRRIILRRERSKKVVSEHSIDDIQLQGEKVLWDNAVNYTKLFTIFDTRSNKQIFSIRPGTNAVNSAGACNELEEFFNQVMRPEKGKRVKEG